MATATGGKVGNMRALFEAKQELSSSPPSRGRSPAGSDIYSIRSASSRPTSKIRSSFIVVEKSGTMGPAFGLRRLSDVQDSPVIDKEFEKKSAGDVGTDGTVDDEEPAKTAAGTPDIAKDTVKKDTGKKKQSEQSAKGKAIPSKEKKPGATASTSIQQGKTTTKHVPSAIDTQPKVVGDTHPKKTQPATPKGLPGKSKAEVTKPLTNRPSPAPKSPLTTSSTKAQSPTASTKKPATISIPRIKQEPISKPASRISTPRTSLASTAAKENKMIKPRPRSPTKPARLPAAAMASTASSAAKTSAVDKPSARGEKPRVSSGNDFLARMMRPTAASASKAHDKYALSTQSAKSLPTRAKRTSAVSAKRTSDVSTNGTCKSGSNDLGPTGYEQETADTVDDPSGHDKVEDTEEAAISDESVSAEAPELVAKSNQSPHLDRGALDGQTGTDTVTNNTAHAASKDHPLANGHSVLLQSNDNATDLAKDDTETADIDEEADHDTIETNTDHEESHVAEKVKDNQTSPATLDESHTEEDVSTSSPHPANTQNISATSEGDVAKESVSETSNNSTSKAEPLDVHSKKDDSGVLQKEENSTADTLPTSQAVEDPDHKAEEVEDS